MIPIQYDFVSGDTESKLELTLKNKDNLVPIDLTDATVYLTWKKESTKIKVPAVILVPAEGKIEYQFQPGDLFAPRMIMEVEIIFSSGKILTASSPFELNVKEKL